MPFAEHIALSAASENDLNILKQEWSSLSERLFIGDKIYHDQPLHAQLWQQQKSKVLTPVKKVKGKAAVLIQHDQAADDLFSRAVSRLRQPIESLFNWLIEKTNLQNASKVRSASGLLVHVFALLAVAFITLAFEPLIRMTLYPVPAKGNFRDIVNKNLIYLEIRSFGFDCIFNALIFILWLLFLQ